MELFSSYLKRYGLKLWLSNLLGSLAIATLFFLTYLFTLIVLAVVGFGLLAFIFPSLQSRESLSLALETMNLESISVGLIVASVFVLLVILLVSMFGYAFQIAGKYAITNEIFRTGRAQIRTFFSQGLKNAWKLVLQQLIIGLITLPIIILWVIAIYLFAKFSSETAFIITGIILILLSLVLSFALALAILHAPLIMIAEKTGPLQALFFSFRIFSKNIGQVLITFLLLFAAAIAYVVLYFVLYLPALLSLLDPTGIIGSIIVLIIYILQWIYSFAGTAFLMAIAGLIVTYRYYKLFRSQLFPHGGSDEYDQPSESTFTFK